MIEINLLASAGKKKPARGGGGGKPKVNLGAAFSGFATKVKDPWLLAAVASVVLAVVVVGGLYSYQTHRISELQDREQVALQDSTRNAVVLRDKEKAEAKRDTLLRQLNLIHAIDEDRFIWPHILDEVSKALPPYTWLTVLNYTGTPQGTVNVAATAKPASAPKADAKAAKSTKKVDTEVPRDQVQVRILGLTADIQALTRFMKQLESSPFLGNVQLNKSELGMDQGKEVTQFTLDVTYTRPDTSMLRRVTLAASVK